MTPQDWETIAPLIQEFGEAINKALQNDTGIDEVLERIKRSPFKCFFTIEVTLGICKKEEVTPRQSKRERKQARKKMWKPLVKDGEVVPEAFSNQDEKFAKQFKISLG